MTDLGTEFGVEVNKKGVTTSHVFRGTIRVQHIGDDAKVEGRGQILHENETVRVEHRAENSLIVGDPAFSPSHFVRELPIPIATTEIKILDLVDVVAGGDGFSGKRNAGIDPTNGRVVHEPPSSPDYLLPDQGGYHRVDGLPFVDGVFVPDARRGAVQIDSAQRRFSDFGSVSHETSHFIWAGGVVPVPPALADRITKIPTVLDGVDYASRGHGLLYFHANKGITFDLDAIRLANPGFRISRFRTVAVNAEPFSPGGDCFADVWVIVDGRARIERRGVRSSFGSFRIVAPLGDRDRFLTLAATDGGNGIASDVILFGDPHLELTPRPARASEATPRPVVKKGE